jgi:ABC-type multidrug transport system ATPase subunit
LENKIIEVTNLSKRFKSLWAVNSLNLNVFKGDIFGFLGPNGAGKSTTIRMLLSLIYPTTGSVKIFEMDLFKNRIKILKRIGAIVEKPDMYGYLSAYKNLEILAKLSRYDITNQRIMEILDIVGLKDRANSKVKTFSSGMKQRLGIAQALIHDPELIILDEPTTGLDPHGMKEIRDLILSLKNDFGKTIFISSHLLFEVEAIATRMIIINKGKTVVEGSVEELLRPKELEVSFNVNDIERAIDIANNMSLEVINKTNEQNFDKKNQVRIKIQRELIPVLNKKFVENDIEVFSITPSRSLEDYFLSLTDGGAK